MISQLHPIGTGRLKPSGHHPREFIGEATYHGFPVRIRLNAETVEGTTEFVVTLLQPYEVED